MCWCVGSLLVVVCWFVVIVFIDCWLFVDCCFVGLLLLFVGLLLLVCWLFVDVCGLLLLLIG